MASKTAPAPRYVPLAAAASYIAVDTKTIRRMISRGELSGRRVGSRIIRVDLNELDALLRPIPSAGNRGDVA